MKAILALSADPVTNGHIDVIKRAREIFPSLIVAIGINPDKKYTFDLAKRENLTKEALLGLDVEVVSFPGLLVDFAKLNSIKTIVRSVRDSTDFNYEKMLNDINLSQKQGIDTVLFFARQSLTHISSTAVKELQKHHGSIVEYVPLVVKQALEEQISKQFLIGITGEIGAGKSFVTNELMTRNVYTNIDMDDLGRKILTEYREPLFIETRQKLLEKIGSEIMGPLDRPGEPCSIINTKILTNLMFRDPRVLNIFNEIMNEPILFALRKALHGLTGKILINSALIAEAGVSYLTNNNIILVKADLGIRIERLKKRGYSPDEIKNRINAQMSWGEKFQHIENKIKESGHGKVIVFDNTSPSEQNFNNLNDSL
jgi:pantetheine-phosphate adenylyltransferase